MGTEVHVRCSSPRRTARGQYDAGAIRHSVGGKVAGDTRLWKCCNPDTSDGKRLWLTRGSPNRTFGRRSVRGPFVAPPIHPTDEAARKPRPHCWGFRLVIIPMGHRAASSTRQTLARPMPSALAMAPISRRLTAASEAKRRVQIVRAY